MHVKHMKNEMSLDEGRAFIFLMGRNPNFTRIKKENGLLIVEFKDPIDQNENGKQMAPFCYRKAFGEKKRSSRLLLHGLSLRNCEFNVA